MTIPITVHIKVLHIDRPARQNEATFWKPQPIEAVMLLPIVVKIPNDSKYIVKDSEEIVAELYAEGNIKPKDVVLTPAGLAFISQELENAYKELDPQPTNQSTNQPTIITNLDEDEIIFEE